MAKLEFTPDERKEILLLLQAEFNLSKEEIFFVTTYTQKVLRVYLDSQKQETDRGCLKIFLLEYLLWKSKNN